jgi:hypothetical protein
MTAHAANNAGTNPENGPRQILELHRRRNPAPHSARGLLKLIEFAKPGVPDSKAQCPPGLHLVSRGRVSFALIGLLPFHG